VYAWRGQHVSAPATKTATTLAPRSEEEAEGRPSACRPGDLAPCRLMTNRATAKTISQVLWDDLKFEREFAFIRATLHVDPKATRSTTSRSSLADELNADGDRRYVRK